MAAFLRADDAELLPYDCEATAVHARRLHAAGLLDDDERPRRSRGSPRSRRWRDRARGRGRPHGDRAPARRRRRKIHAGRSRNDQVAAAFRLYVADAAGEARAAIAPLAARFSTARRRTPRRRCRATRTSSGRSRSRSGTTCSRGSRCSSGRPLRCRRGRRGGEPLGAGALAGSTLPLPAPANQLRNSLDAVADRDFALDYLYAAAVCFVHLSRIGEELVLWTTTEFGFARLGEDAATGSSMMPQKLNPTSPSSRGKAGTAIGRLTGLLATVKGLPLAYNRDLQETEAPSSRPAPISRLRWRR